MSKTRDPEDLKQELLMTYMRGWKHGASARAMDGNLAMHPNKALQCAYETGYRDGHAACVRAGADYANVLGYDPSFDVLRTGGK